MNSSGSPRHLYCPRRARISVSAFWTTSWYPRSNTEWGYYFKIVNRNDVCKKGWIWHRTREGWLKLWQVPSSWSHHCPLLSWLVTLHALDHLLFERFYIFTSWKDTDFLRPRWQNGLCKQTTSWNLSSTTSRYVTCQNPVSPLSLSFLICTYRVSTL